MKTVVEMARKAGLWAFRGPGLRPHVPEDVFAGPVKITKEIERLVELVRADEREQGQKWFNAVTAQHKQAILAERKACARVCESQPMRQDIDVREQCAAAIRARSST